nr:MAK10-like protein [Tanacetum cinerariifolium]
MGDANPIRTLGDYSRPSHEGYRNTIKLPEGTNVVTLRSDTIRITKESWALLEDLALYDNKSWNNPRDFTKPVKAISLPQDVLSTSDRRLIELGNQLQRLMETYIAPMQPTQTISEKLDDAPIHNTAGNTTAQMNFTFTNYPTKEELRGQGIKSPSKLLSLKYLSQSSLAKQNRNPSSSKYVHFVNSIVLLNKEDAAKEEGNVKSCITEYKDHEMTVESEEEFEEETKEEIKEEKEDSLEHFDTVTPPILARSGILGSRRATSWINNTRYILNDQRVV